MNRTSLVRPLLCAVLLAMGSSCQIIRNYGTGTHLDTPRDHPHDTNPGREREIIVVVTTDAEGKVAEIHFERSSGKEGIDAYVAETVRQGWPQQPSTRSIASVTYSTEKGFSAPKVLSSAPVH